ncbi:hypothetical protein [Piscinibacter sp.]|uniref:hypothetical protein n=1 Tax=Piscinibacter sp. TaxID=1903157 RepID=UPI0039E4F4E4
MTAIRSLYKKEYARILEHGPSSESDFALARELIDAGFADGKYQVSKGRDDRGRVAHVLGFQINTKGRVFLDELCSAIEKETWAHRLKMVGVWSFGVVSALVIGLVSGLGVEILKAYLPK